MWKRLVTVFTLLVIVCATTFIVNQTAQVVSLANAVSPVLGRVVLIGLLAVYAAVILVPVALLLLLPKPISPPADEQSAEYQTYLRRLGARLAANPELIDAGPLNDRISIESALKILDAKADCIIRNTASTLFVSTAVSQNGSLDALMVLAEQARLVWRVAHIYNQRPAPQELGKLYANVGATVFAASQLDDLDARAQIEPVIRAAVGGGVAGFVPGLAEVGSIVTHAVLDGTANAYLTLRVGIICQTYCRSITAIDRNTARRDSSLAAASMLGSIVAGSAGSVIKAIAAATRKAGGSVVESAATGIRGAAAKLNPFKRERDR